LAYNSVEVTRSPIGTAYALWLAGPPVSGCDGLRPTDVQFQPAESAYLTTYWESISGFDVVVRTGWNSTSMSVFCRGREFRACDVVPGRANFSSDWREQVPLVPHASLPVVCALLAVLVAYIGATQAAGRCHQRRLTAHEEGLLPE
jgi:hypothetical protein